MKKLILVAAMALTQQAQAWGWGCEMPKNECKNGASCYYVFNDFLDFSHCKPMLSRFGGPLIVIDGENLQRGDFEDRLIREQGFPKSIWLERIYYGWGK